MQPNLPICKLFFLNVYSKRALSQYALFACHILISTHNFHYFWIVQRLLQVVIETNAQAFVLLECHILRRVRCTYHQVNICDAEPRKFAPVKAKIMTGSQPIAFSKSLIFIVASSPSIVGMIISCYKCVNFSIVLSLDGMLRTMRIKSYLWWPAFTLSSASAPLEAVSTRIFLASNTFCVHLRDISLSSATKIFIGRCWDWGVAVPGVFGVLTCDDGDGEGGESASGGTTGDLIDSEEILLLGLLSLYFPR